MASSESSRRDVSQSRSQQLAGEAIPLSGPLTGVKICVIGAGFVGCVAAAGFAKFGHTVVCVEKSPDRLAQLKDGRLPFYERDLEDLVRCNVECKRLSFSSQLEDAIEGQEAVFITVGTPSKQDGRADLTALEEIVVTLSERLQPHQILVLKSTVPVGTARWLKEILRQNRHGDNTVPIISSPEFLREGTAVYDFFHPHRIVIGGDSPKAIQVISYIYRMGMTNPVPIIITNNQTAEMIKYASNAFLAAKIGLVNELAKLCDSVGVNVMEVARAMGLDSRIGHEFLNPGPGWGGSCLPKDLKEFLGLADSRGVSLSILQAVKQANQEQLDYVVSKVKRLVGTVKNKHIGAFGLTFKAETSDLRDSPAIAVVERLIDEGAKVKAFDPAAKDEEVRLLSKAQLVRSPYDAVRDADCIVILTEWSEFQLLDWKKVAKLVRHLNIIDARNILTPEVVRGYGYNYLSMGQV